MKSIIVLLLVIVAVGCTDISAPGDKIIKTEIVWGIVDSFAVEYPQVRFADAAGNKLLFYNQNSQDIIIVNRSGLETMVFNKFGQGDLEHDFLTKERLKFVNDSILGVVSFSHRRIKKYNISGEYLGDEIIERENNRLASFSYLGDSIIIVHTPADGLSTIPQYYKNKKTLFIKKQLSTNNERCFAAFPPEGSVYFDEDYYYYNSFLFHFKIENTSNTLYFLSENDPAIYTYNLSNLQLTYRLPLDLTSYKPLKFRFGHEIKDFREDAINNYLNSYIKDFFLLQKYIVILYVENYSKQFIVEFEKNHPDFPDYEFPETKYHINIIDRVNNISILDSPIPSEYGELIHVDSINSMLFRKPLNEIDEKQGKTSFYIIRASIHAEI